MDETEHTCQFCYYEYFDGRAYPCSMCGCGEERKDMFMPKGRQNKRKDEPQWTKENCKGCKYNEYPYDSGTCFVRVCINGNKYEPKDEPQTDCAWR